MSRYTTYTKEQITWLKNNYCKYSLKQATKLFNETFNENKTTSAIVGKAKWLKIKTASRFTKEEIKFLREFAPKLTNKELYTEFTIRFGNRKSLEQLREVVLKTLKIKKNKETVSRANHKDRLDKFPIGYIKKANILFIKVKDEVNNPYNNYMPYHYYVLEQNGIKVKDNQVVKFKDGNPYNCNLDNLLVISKPTFIYMNQNNLWNKGEITKTALKIGELNDLLKN